VHGLAQTQERGHNVDLRFPARRKVRTEGQSGTEVGSLPDCCLVVRDVRLEALWVPKTFATWADSRGNASARGLCQVAGGQVCARLCVR
jgi:hypothetical protein